MCLRGRHGDGATALPPLCGVFPHAAGDMFFVKENASEATGSFPVLTQVRTETGSLSSSHGGMEALVTHAGR